MIEKIPMEERLENFVQRDVIIRNPDFIVLLERMRKIHDAKSTDYAEDDDLYKNFRECEDMGIPAWKGIVVRMTDKFSRLKGFAKRETLVVDEDIEDTLLDMANYCLLTILTRREAIKEMEYQRKMFVKN